MLNRPQFMYECPCGYSLKSALSMLSQAEISRMMENHIRVMHLAGKDD